ncbi:MAG: hypothetical protein ACT4NV_17040 [Rhodoferax sp.]
MNALHTELARLYHTAPPHTQLHAPLHGAVCAPLADANGQVRAAVLELARPADWGTLGALWRGVQTDLDLPAPGIAINGHDGYQLWFSWQQPIEAAQAQAFVAALCARYLQGVAPARLRCWPGGANAAHDPHAQDGSDSGFPAPVPALHPRSGQWSAYIAPDLASVFADEPWLDRDPGLEAQTQLLARLQSIRPEAFAQAQQTLLPPAAPATATPTQAAPAASAPTGTPIDTTAPYPAETPGAFLQAVMQDPQAPLALRVQAAVALLRRDSGYFLTPSSQTPI